MATPEHMLRQHDRIKQMPEYQGVILAFRQGATFTFFRDDAITIAALVSGRKQADGSYQTGILTEAEVERLLELEHKLAIVDQRW